MPSIFDALLSIPSIPNSAEWILLLTTRCPGQAIVSTANTYLTSLHLAKAVEASLPQPDLDPVETRLLQFIALAIEPGGRLSVRDLIYKDELGSHAILHRRLQVVRQKGWLTLVDSLDIRRKQLTLTGPAVSFLASLADCITEALH